MNWVGSPNTLEDDALGALCNEDPSQTQIKHSSALDVTHEAIVKRLNAWRIIQKMKVGLFIIWSQVALSILRLPMNNCSSGKKRRRFFIASLGRKKNRFITAIQAGQNHGHRPVMVLRHGIGWIFTVQRFCILYDGIRAVLFIIGCWYRAKRSLGNRIDLNCWDLAKRCRKCAHHTSRGTTMVF